MTFFLSLILPMLPPVEMPAQLDTTQARYVLEVSGWHVDDIPDALAVMQCESGMNSQVTADGGHAIGLFQVHGVGVGWDGWLPWLKEKTGRVYDLLDPYQNAHAALLIFKRSGWAIWSCSP